MEKRAEQIKTAGSHLREAVIAVHNENAHNIKLAAHNRNCFFTGEGKPLPYETAAFRNMIRTANNLIGMALAEE